MADGSGNWTWDNETADVIGECNMSLVNTTWLESQMYAGKMVDRAVTPVWYLVGIIGNVVSAWIWTRRRMRRNNSSAVYLATLSVNDTLFLLLHIVQELKVAWDQGTVDYLGICESYAFIYLVTQYLAPMLVLGFTVERFIAVCYPYQKVRYCTAGRAVKVCLCMIVGCLLLGSMQLYLWSYNPDEQKCLPRPSTYKDGAKFFSIWSWITEMMIFLVVPLIILIVNILVMREVCRMSNPAVESAMSSSRLKPSKSAATNAMLLSVSFYVIFTTLPATLVYVMQQMFDEGPYCDAAGDPIDMASDPTWNRHVVFTTVQKIVYEICLSHYACNFFLFSITGLEFRRELRRTLRCRGAGLSHRSSIAENGASEYTMATTARPHGRDSPQDAVETEELQSTEELHSFVVDT